MNRLCLALDNFKFNSQLEDCVKNLHTLIKMYKVGLESYTAFGWNSIRSILKYDCEVFLDLKLHDIPKTIEKTVRSIVKKYPISYLTVHTLGGKDMLEAAIEGAQGKTKIIGVTILTSLSNINLIYLDTI